MFSRAILLFIAAGLSTVSVGIAVFILIFLGQSLQPFSIAGVAGWLVGGVFLILCAGTAAGVVCDLHKRKRAASGYSMKVHLLAGAGSVAAGTLLINLAVHLLALITRSWSYLAAICTTWLLLAAALWLALLALGAALKRGTTETRSR